MMLVEQTTISAGDLPVAAFRAHLRLGTGFADDDVQDPVLEAHLRAAIAAIEGRTAKATLTRAFRWQVGAWRDPAAQILPVAPVQAVTGMMLVARDGGEEAVAPARYALVPDTHRPRLVGVGAALPQIPVGGAAVILFEAGYGATWGDMPADLAHAVLLLAAQYYEDRADPGAGALPDMVATLTARYCDLRLLGGGRA